MNYMVVFPARRNGKRESQKQTMWHVEMVARTVEVDLILDALETAIGSAKDEIGSSIEAQIAGVESVADAVRCRN